MNPSRAKADVKIFHEKIYLILFLTWVWTTLLYFVIVEVMMTKFHFVCDSCFKGIVHFEIKMWYLSAYPKGIQDVGVFFSSVDPILMFLGQTVLVCQSYNGRYRSLSL